MTFSPAIAKIEAKGFVIRGGAKDAIRKALNEPGLSEELVDVFLTNLAFHHHIVERGNQESNEDALKAAQLAFHGMRGGQEVTFDFCHKFSMELAAAGFHLERN